MEKQKIQYETKFGILLGFNSNNNPAEGVATGPVAMDGDFHW